MFDAIIDKICIGYLSQLKNTKYILGKIESDILFGASAAEGMFDNEGQEFKHDSAYF